MAGFFRGPLLALVCSAALLGTALAGLQGCKKLASLAKPKQPPAFHRPRVDAAFARMLDKLTDDPKFQEALKRGPEGAPGQKLDLAVKASGNRELGAQLAAKGTARLSPVEFLQLTKLKLKLSEKSPKLCAGFWSGGIELSDLGAGLDTLTDEEIERWFVLSERATHLELYATTPLPRFPGKVLIEGFRDISAALPESEREPFVATLKQGAAASPAAGCQAYQQLTRGALTFPEARRDTFMRGLMFDKLVDW
jgi:hypothetical protein